MKTQEILNRVRSEAQHVWGSISNQYHHLEQINNPAIIPYQTTEASLENGNSGKEAQESRWGMLPVDSYELDGHLLVTMEIPGMDPSAIDIRIEGNELVISGEKRKSDQRKDCEKELYSEIAYGEFERRIALTGRRLKKADHDASYEQGVLTISLPYDKDGMDQPARKISVQ